MAGTAADGMATVAASTDRALTPTTGAVDSVMAEAMQAGQLVAFMVAAVSTAVAGSTVVADAAKSTKLPGRHGWQMLLPAVLSCSVTNSATGCTEFLKGNDPNL